LPMTSTQAVTVLGNSVIRRSPVFRLISAD
jgi:hypothetical protein